MLARRRRSRLPRRSTAKHAAGCSTGADHEGIVMIDVA